jgi:hypothetical protein
MSSASLAKKRRANLSQPNPNTPSPQFESSNTPQTRNVTLTLPQVLQIIDSRLLKLEKVVKSQSEQPETTVVKEKEDDLQLKELLAEYDERFQILANEIQDIKEIVLKLQSYTMDVNKTLLEERIEIMNMNNNVPRSSTNETIEMIERIQNDTPPEIESNLVEEEEAEMDDQLYNMNNDMSVEDVIPDMEMEHSLHKKEKRKGKR